MKGSVFFPHIGAETSPGATARASFYGRIAMSKRISSRRRRVVKSLVTVPLGIITATEAPWGGRQEPHRSDREFARTTGYRLDDHVRQSRLAVLPLGSIEYHGPSGPPLTDSVIAVGLAERVAARVNASVFPVVTFTHCPAHTAGFRGSISVRPEVVTMYLSDILRGIVANGFRRIFLLNAHDGNIGPARMAISQVTAEQSESQMMLVNWWETLPSSLVESLHLFTSGNGGHGHGGPLELSVAAVFASASVEPGKGPDRPALSPLADDVPFYLEKSRADGWSGYSGKLSEISRDKGERLAVIVVEKLASLVEEWLKKPNQPGSW
jgi:creatinine amidohydrolase